MEKNGLIVGIDYTNEYCQICYYSQKHKRPESVMAGSTVLHYQIPSVLTFDDEHAKWLVGEAAQLCSKEKGTYLFKNLLNGIVNGDGYLEDGKKQTYDRLLAIFFGNLLEMVQAQAGMTKIENITVNLRRVNLDYKKAIEKSFALLNVGNDRLRVVSSAESFVYFVLNEDSSQWKDGALLFDFDSEGFYVRSITREGKKKELFNVIERSRSTDYSLIDLGSELQRVEMDGKLCALYKEYKGNGQAFSVYFTGQGFNDLWFKRTLEEISKEYRAFRGNNLYVRGACLAGMIRATEGQKDYPIICKGRTKASISIPSMKNGFAGEKTMLRAAENWYDSKAVCDFIAGEDKNVEIVITSVVTMQKSRVQISLADFPDRPVKTTRIGVSAEYVNDGQCRIRVWDKGFGNLFPASKAQTEILLNMEDYI